jgi:protocatechuate 3,4-dioxygenase beta subunit
MPSVPGGESGETSILATTRRSLLAQGAAMAALFSSRVLAAAREPVIGGPCEGCEWVFDGQPAALSSTARIAPADEPGVPMVIEGVVTGTAGAPAARVIVYAYHTDREGLYPPAGNRHGRLRGWVRTDARGQFRLDTIRPGAYPSRQIAEHVHLHVIEPGVGTYYIDDLEFEDDPLNTRRRGAERGGKGLAMPVRRQGIWHVRRDIVLGLNIPGHPGR